MLDMATNIDTCNVQRGPPLEWIFSMHNVTHSVSSLTSGAKIATVLLGIAKYITTEVKFV